VKPSPSELICDDEDMMVIKDLILYEKEAPIPGDEKKSIKFW